MPILGILNSVLAVFLLGILLLVCGAACSIFRKRSAGIHSQRQRAGVRLEGRQEMAGKREGWNVVRRAGQPMGERLRGELQWQAAR